MGTECRRAGTGGWIWCQALGKVEGPEVAGESRHRAQTAAWQEGKDVLVQQAVAWPCPCQGSWSVFLLPP